MINRQIIFSICVSFVLISLGLTISEQASVGVGLMGIGLILMALNVMSFIRASSLASRRLIPIANPVAQRLKHPKITP